MSVTEVSPHNGSLDWSIAASILRGTRPQLVGPDSWRTVSFRLSMNLRYVQMSYVTGDLERFVDTMYRNNSIELLKLKGGTPFAYHRSLCGTLPTNSPGCRNTCREKANGTRSRPVKESPHGKSQLLSLGQLLGSMEISTK